MPKFYLSLGVLLLMLIATGSSPAGAAATSTMAAPSTAAAPPSESSSPAAFLCGLNASVPSGRAIGQPEPLLKTFPPLCGICSDFSCQTQSVGSVCPGIGTLVQWHCYDISGTCPEDGNVKCSCRKNVP
jgi:hypothetical protein